MCGIAGGVDGLDEQVVSQMCAVMTHRGPDHSNVRRFGAAVLGMVRLSIIDLAGGNQPIANEDESVWVVFNGEIYNYESLRTELTGLGHRFSTNSDTETIVHAYEEWGEGCVQRLRGMFAIAIWDVPKEKLFLARDRIGEKPLYYWQGPGELRFASEIKCLLETDIPRRVNHNAVNTFLALGYVAGEETAYEGVFKLNPGELAVWQQGQLRRETYWALPENSPPESPRSFVEAVDQLDALLLDAVQGCMKSDVEIAAFLSGGVDSSLIVAMMKKLGADVRTYSVGYDGAAAGFNELSFAKQVSEHLGTTHHELILSATDNLNLLPQITTHYDEPNGEPTSLLVYLLCEFVSRDVKVAMGGTGGDELFQGYPRHTALRFLEYTQHIPNWLANPARWITELGRDSTQGSRLMKRVKRFAHNLGQSPSAAYLGWLQLLRPEVRAQVYPYHLRGDEALAERLAEAGDLHAGVLQIDAGCYLPEYQLTYMDRMSMATSLEVRSPLCDYKVAEFAATLPHEYRLRGGRTKHILKAVAQRYLPEAIVERRKVGFDSPIGQWFKAELRPFLSEFLGRDAIARSGLLEPTAVDALVQAHLSGRQDYSMQLWSLISLEMWHRHFILGEPQTVTSSQATTAPSLATGG